MKATVIDNDTIVTDDGKYYKFSEDDCKNAIAAIGDRVRFKPEGTQAKNIFIIQPEDESKPAENDPQKEPQRSEQTIKAARDYELLSVAKWQGILSALLPALIKIYIVFFDVFGKKQEVLEVVAITSGMILTYCALKNIATISQSPDIHTNYAKSMFILIGLSAVMIIVSSLMLEFANLIVAVKLAALALLIYVFMIQFNVFSELARLTRNGLFRKYIVFYSAGFVMVVLDFLSFFGGIFLLVSFFIYIFAWKGTFEVVDFKSDDHFVYR